MSGNNNNNNNAGLGSLGVAPLIHSPPLPTIVAEWAAILPLICHLASQRDDYITTGDVALQGKLSIGLFPRLGTLPGLSRLLERGTEYLDYASTKGGSSRTVWDVKWGSLFPCANGAAIHALSRYLLSRNKGRRAQRMPETIQPPADKQDAAEKASIKDDQSVKTFMSHRDGSVSKDAEKDAIRRYQTLHVYRLHRAPMGQSLRRRINQLMDTLSFKIVYGILFISLAVFLGLFGCYGTAAVIVCSTVSELVAHKVQIRRPPGYLKNSENHDACMLVAAHENATEWHLYIGDRAVVDTLLNKPMFLVPQGQTAKVAAWWFWSAHLIQLAAMTYVASQKGWDGTCLMILLAAHWAFYSLRTGEALAQDWLEREGVDAQVRSFEFGGRFAMMGAIQLFGGSDATRWMDTILVPHPRREAWIQRLKGDERPTPQLDASDAGWLEFASEASFAAFEVLKREFGQEDAPINGA